MLDIAGLVAGQFILSPLAAAARNFNMLLILGDSAVISGLERKRQYSSLDQVLVDFSPTSPEALAATRYFGQSPRPASLMIGRWLAAATAGALQGGFLTTGQQAMSNWTGITTGSVRIPVDGVNRDLTGLNFSAAANLNAVAAIIQAALPAGVTCVWNGSQFVVTSSTTGTASSVAYALPVGSGTDISAQLKLTAGTALQVLPGYAAETADAAIGFFANNSALWYGVTFAATATISAGQHVTNAALVQGLSVARVYAVTTMDAASKSAASTTDLGYLLKAAGYTRTFCQYSSSDPYAVCSAIGREFSVDFSQPNSTITLMYKQEPGVVAEDLTFTEAAVLQTKRINVFVSYNNDTSLLQYGTMSGSAYFDEIHGLDWLTNNVQTAMYNVLYTSNKVAQTDIDNDKLVNAASGILGQAKANKLLAPGKWTSTFEFGQLHTGDYLKNGYYIDIGSVDDQSQADREARKAPPITIAGKLAGANHTLSFVIEANR
jgi:hypothetical protein